MVDEKKCLIQLECLISLSLSLYLSRKGREGTEGQRGREILAFISFK